MTEDANVWTIEELVKLTDQVQTGKVTYRGKDFHFQFCELAEKEEPNLKAIPEDASDQEKQDWAKANDKNPDGITLTSENWSSVPVTLRYQITSEILSYQQEITENFTTG